MDASERLTVVRGRGEGQDLASTRLIESTVTVRRWSWRDPPLPLMSGSVIDVQTERQAAV